MEEIHGKDIYLAHLNHLEIRRHYKDFWVDNCPACEMHKLANERSKNAMQNAPKADRVWNRWEQR